jgi:hypothetical protein
MEAAQEVTGFGILAIVKLLPPQPLPYLNIVTISLDIHVCQIHVTRISNPVAQSMFTNVKILLNIAALVHARAQVPHQQVQPRQFLKHVQKMVEPVKQFA